MVDPRATRFWHAALQSGLIDEAALQVCWDALPEAKRTPDACERRLARQAVTAGYLSLWQAQRILGGRSQGFQVDKYVLLDRIGQGGMGQVYLAKDTRLNRRVALKVLSPERMNNPRALARFLREAKVGAQLQHENLVRIYDEGDCNGLRYLVMEYIEGQNAGRLVAEKGPLRPARAARLVREVALGLAHAHQKGLIHRDVNPWNILITKEGTAKLTDLGLAIDLGDAEDAVTRDGATVGTFDYISPEQARHSRSVDTRSDIYSLGCTLYHMVTGRVPFPMPSLPEKLYAHQTADPEPMGSLVPGVPPGLDDVLRKMMKKKPDERYADPSEVARALEPFVEAGVAPSSSSLTVTPLAATVSATAAGTMAGQRAAQPATSPAPDVTSPLADTAESSQLSSHSGSPADADLGGLMPALDLGPELPLSDSISGVKPKYRPARPDRKQLQVAAVGAAALILTLGVAALAVKGCGSGPGTPVVSGAEKDTHRAVSAIEPRSTAKGETASTSAPAGERPAISVRYADGTEKPFDSGDAYEDLHEAIQSASRGKAEIVLRNRKPLVVKVKRALSTSGGSVVIRAGKNETPVLFVELAGNEPFLVSKVDNTETSLVLERLTIQATYEGTGPPVPLIKAAGNLRLDHCAFSTSGAKRETAAVSAEGLKTTITDCWFEGFSRTVDVSAFADSECRLKNCMLIQDEAAEHPAGWALAVHRAGSTASPGARGANQKSRHIALERCTATGAGLMQLDDLLADSAVYIDVRDTAVRAQALVQWKSREADPGKALRWTGAGNRYDIQGAAWIVQPPSGPNSIAVEVKDSPTDLESWVKLVKEETGSKVESLRFKGAPAGPSAGSHVPEDYALEGTGSTSVGADPARVGPAAQHTTTAARP